jgi:hypothetical protein
MARKRNALLIGSDQAREDWASVLALPEGQRVLWRIITASGLLEPNGSLNSHALMAFNEGRRALGDDVFQAISAIDPNWIPLLLQNALNDQLQMELSE